MRGCLGPLSLTRSTIRLRVSCPRHSSSTTVTRRLNQKSPRGAIRCAMAQAIQYACLEDHGVILEYELPSSSRRLDFLICGRDRANRDEAVIVELKQWSQCEAAEADGLVMNWVGGRNREVRHPSVQIGQYQQYLADTHSAFYDGEDPIRLGACSYLHNYEIQANDALVASKFSDVMVRYPVFGSDAVDGLKDYLRERLITGQGP